MTFLSIQVAHTTHILSLSSHYFVVPILSLTHSFLPLFICGTVLMFLCVMSLPLYHLNVTLHICILIRIMSRISYTLLFTCIPCFHANIYKNKKNKSLMVKLRLGLYRSSYREAVNTLLCALENGSDLHVNECQKI